VLEKSVFFLTSAYYV